MKLETKSAGLLLCLTLMLQGCGGMGGDTATSGTGGGNAGNGNSGSTISSVAASQNGATGITLSWNAVTGASGYNVYRATSANQALQAMTKLTSSPIAYGSVPYYDTGLTPATSYYYKVTWIANSAENTAPETSATTAARSTLIHMGGAMQGNPLTLTNKASTVASGFSTPSYITTDGTNVYLTEQGTRSVLKVNPTTGTSTVLLGNGSCTAALCNPRGITADGTSLYIVDQNGGTTTTGGVYKIDLATGTSSTFVGSGLYLPTVITTDGVNIYVGDFNGIKKYDIATGTPTTLSTTSVRDLTTDGNYLYTINGNAIQKVDMVTGAITRYAGTVTVSGQKDGVGGQATLASPYCLTSDGTSLYVTQWTGLASLPLRKIDIATATVSTISSATSSIGITTDGVRIYNVNNASSAVLNKLE